MPNKSLPVKPLFVKERALLEQTLGQLTPLVHIHEDGSLTFYSQKGKDAYREWMNEPLLKQRAQDKASRNRLPTYETMPVDTVVPEEATNQD
jgi:hypothetical protein